MRPSTYPGNKDPNMFLSLFGLLCAFWYVLTLEDKKLGKYRR